MYSCYIALAVPAAVIHPARNWWHERLIVEQPLWRVAYERIGSLWVEQGGGAVAGGCQLWQTLGARAVRVTGEDVGHAVRQ